MPNNFKETEVIIIGAGVLGVSLAYHLSLLKIHCLVLEKEPFVASHASGKNAGMFRQLYRHQSLTRWAKRSQELWPEELKELYFKKRGSLVVGRTLPGHHQELFEQRSFAYPEEASQRNAVYCPSDGLLDSPGYVQHLKRLCDSKFVQFRFSSEVASLNVGKNEKFRMELKNGEQIRSLQVVNTAGAWINKFLTGELSQLRVQAQPFARHLFVIQGWPTNYMPHRECGYFWDEDSAWYMREWDSKSRLVSICDRCAASSPEKFQADPTINQQVANTLLERLPNIADQLSISHSWHCFRTYTEDLLPIFGPQAELPKLFWLSAFGGFGMSTSFGATEEAALHIAGLKKSAQMDFSPERVQNKQSETAQIAKLGNS